MDRLPAWLDRRPALMDRRPAFPFVFYQCRDSIAKQTMQSERPQTPNNEFENTRQLHFPKLPDKSLAYWHHTTDLGLLVWT